MPRASSDENGAFITKRGSAVLGLRTSRNADSAAAGVSSLVQAVEQPLHDHEEQRNKKDAKERAGHHAAENTRADGALRARAGAGGESERQDADPEGERGHQNRTQAVAHRA